MRKLCVRLLLVLSLANVCLAMTWFVYVLLFGAIGATAVWEVRSTGSQTNGGFYTSGGTDYSQQNAAQYALTGCTSAGAGNTVLNANAAADMVGNGGYCASGTNFTTSEWFEVASVSVGVSITFSTSHAAAAICTGIGADGVINIGGAFKIGGTKDDEFFDSIRAGNIVYVASTAGGVTYTLGEAVSMASAGTDILPINFIAYKDTRATMPTIDDRPTIALGAYSFMTSVYNNWQYFKTTSSETTGFRTGSQNNLYQCKFTNTGGGTNYAILIGYNNQVISCEAVSKGYAFGVNSGVSLINCYAHDSVDGIFDQGGSQTGIHILNCIIETCNVGIDLVSGEYGSSFTNNVIRNCTTGISGAASYSNSFINNIISDCLTGVSWNATYGKSNIWLNNCFNNTTDHTNVTLGSTNLEATDSLLSSSLASGTDGATNAGGTVFTAASAPFGSVTTADCLLIKEAGTGANLGVFAITGVDSTSQLTLTTTAGANKSGITYGLIKGSNWTLQAASPCLGAGLEPSSLIGIE